VVHSAPCFLEERRARAPPSPEASRSDPHRLSYGVRRASKEILQLVQQELEQGVGCARFVLAAAAAYRIRTQHRQPRTDLAGFRWLKVSVRLLVDWKVAVWTGTFAPKAVEATGALTTAIAVCAGMVAATVNTVPVKSVMRGVVNWFTPKSTVGPVKKVGPWKNPFGRIGGIGFSIQVKELSYRAGRQSAGDAEGNSRRRIRGQIKLADVKGCINAMMFEADEARGLLSWVTKRYPPAGSPAPNFSETVMVIPVFGSVTDCVTVCPGCPKTTSTGPKWAGTTCTGPDRAPKPTI